MNVSRLCEGEERERADRPLRVRPPVRESEQKSTHLQRDDAPHDAVVAVEEPFVLHRRGVRVVHARQPDEDPNEGQLDVADPHADLGALEDLFEVDAGKARGAAGEEHGDQAHHLAAGGRFSRGGGGGAAFLEA